MTQSLLNKHVKTLAYSDETISSSQLKIIVSEYDKVVAAVDVFNHYFKFYSGIRIIMLAFMTILF